MRRDVSFWTAEINKKKKPNNNPQPSLHYHFNTDRNHSTSCLFSVSIPCSNSHFSALVMDVTVFPQRISFYSLSGTEGLALHIMCALKSMGRLEVGFLILSTGMTSLKVTFFCYYSIIIYLFKGGKAFVLFNISNLRTRCCS